MIIYIEKVVSHMNRGFEIRDSLMDPYCVNYDEILIVDMHI